MKTLSDKTPWTARAARSAIVATIMLGGLSSTTAHGQSLDKKATTKKIQNATAPSALLKYSKRLAFDPSRKLMRLNMGLTGQRTAQFAALLASQQDPKNPNYHNVITENDYLRLFAPSSTQVTAVEQWVVKNRLTISTISPDEQLIEVQGTVAEIDKALHVNINEYRKGSRTFLSATTAPTVPGTLPVSSIEATNYLQARPMDLTTTRSFPAKAKPRKTHKATSVSPGLVIPKNETPGTSKSKLAHSPAAQPAASNFAASAKDFLPSDLIKAYNVANFANGGNQTIAMVCWGVPTTQADLDGFARLTGTPRLVIGAQGANGVDFIQQNGTNQDSNPSASPEIATDVEIAHGLAPNSHIKYYLAGSVTAADIEQQVNAAANDTSVHIVSASWGIAGPPGTPFQADPAIDQALQHAASVGTTFYFASGDSGAVDTSYPASNPNVVSVGGTVLNVNTDGTYANESAWSQGGSGCQTFYARPSWQVGIAAATCAGRAFPDIAADSSLDSAVVTFEGGRARFTGGTSVAAPIIAGIMADMNSALEVSGQAGVGFAAPIFYSLANSSTYSSDFHDVTTGNNGRGAGTAWDEATGWGSLNVANFYSDLSKFSAAVTAASSSPIPTNSAVASNTPVATNSATNTSTATSTPTVIPGSTNTPTTIAGATNTPAPVNTDTATAGPTDTATGVPSDTAVPSQTAVAITPPTVVTGTGATVTLYPSSGAPGAPVAIGANGFDAGSQVQLLWNGTVKATTTAYPDGRVFFVGQINTAAVPGTQTIEVKEVSGATSPLPDATTTFTVLAQGQSVPSVGSSAPTPAPVASSAGGVASPGTSLVLLPKKGGPNTRLIIDGLGLTPGSVATLYWKGEAVASLIVNQYGQALFLASTSPTIVAGTRTVWIQDAKGVSTETLTFAVEGAKGPVLS